MYSQIKQIKILKDADVLGWLGVSNDTVYDVEKMYHCSRGERFCNVVNDEDKIVSVPELFYTISL